MVVLAEPSELCSVSQDLFVDSEDRVLNVSVPPLSRTAVFHHLPKGVDSFVDENVFGNVKTVRIVQGVAVTEQDICPVFDLELGVDLVDVGRKVVYDLKCGVGQKSFYSSRCVVLKQSRVPVVFLLVVHALSSGLAPAYGSVILVTDFVRDRNVVTDLWIVEFGPRVSVLDLVDVMCSVSVELTDICTFKLLSSLHQRYFLRALA